MKQKKKKDWYFVLIALFLGFIAIPLKLFEFSGNLVIITFLMPITLYLISGMLGSLITGNKFKSYILPILVMTVSFFAIAYSFLGISALGYKVLGIAVFAEIMRTNFYLFLASVVLTPFISLFFNTGGKK